MKHLAQVLLTIAVAGTYTACLLTPARSGMAAGCAAAPSSSLIVNVKDKGAKGDGRANDTAAIQRAINEVAGKGGTVFVPSGTYMVRTTGKRRLTLKSKMTFRLSEDAILKAIPNSAKSYSILRIAKATDVTVSGGILQGDRREHRSKSGEWGMGILIGPKSKRITISGVTAKDMWGDGFYVAGATDVTFCSVIADHNRRQGLSITAAKRLVVTDSVFMNTRGTRPSAGIDIEPNKGQKVTAVRIVHSKFINNAGGGIMIAGKRGPVSNVEIGHNLFRERRPILVENAPAVKSVAICNNRLIRKLAAPKEGLNAFAETVEVVSLQEDCREGRDIRFEVKRQSKKRKPPR